MLTRYFYPQVDDNSRLAVAFTYDYETGSISYGASLFQRAKRSDFFKKVNQRRIAEKRLEVRPVLLRTEGIAHLSMVQKLILESMEQFGVRGPRKKKQQ